MSIPERKRQIQRVHADFIHEVVAACHDPDRRTHIDAILQRAQQQGWQALVAVVRRIIRGEREASLLMGLDEEDSAIAEAILLGLQDPDNLPELQAPGDAGMAAPGLAAMIHAASRGDVQALQMLGHMAEQMQQAGGEMARIGAVLRPMVNGERDVELLSRKLNGQGLSLLKSILEELGQLESH